MNKYRENKEIEKIFKRVRFDCFGSGAPTSTKGMLTAIGHHMGAF